MQEVINEMILQKEAIFGIGGVTYTTPKQGGGQAIQE